MTHFEQIRARIKAAAPGPWSNEDGIILGRPSAPKSYAAPPRGNFIAAVGDPVNADFIAHAHSDLTWALEEIERLGAYIDAAAETEEPQ